MNLSEIVGNNIRFHRTKQNMSQEELAEYSDLHPSYIGQLERGKKKPTVDTLYKISRGLKVPLSTILGGIDELDDTDDNYPYKCYLLVNEQSASNQIVLYELLRNVLKIK
ncbi:MAG: helix-turn-helix domain-containing protein [Coprococcus sp.]